MKLKICGCVLFVMNLFTNVLAEVTDKQYLLMPDIFQIDDYERCRISDDSGLYCFITFQLRPKNHSKKSDIWNIIEEVSSKRSNYRHDMLRHGICIPKSCPDANGLLPKQTIEIREKLTKCYNQKYEHMGLEGEIVKMHCENKDPPYTNDIYDKIFALVVLSYFALVVFASFYEGLARYKTEKEYKEKTQTFFGQFVSAFSIPKNWERLRTINDKDPDVKALSCIQGIRFYNMTLVIFAHTSLLYLISPVSNTLYVERVTFGGINAYTMNGTYVVQTFFLISGWLLTYNFYHSVENNKKKITFSFMFKILIDRYMRLTPIMVLLIGFQSTWFVHMGRGPLWDRAVGEEYRKCRENWWTNLLYINTFVNKENMCQEHTWYLATEIQLYVLSLIILYLMKKHEKYVAFILGGTMAIGLVIPGTLSYINNYDSVVRTYPEPLYDIFLYVPEFHIMYTHSYSNITGYVLGITFGYIFYKNRGKNLVTTKIFVILWWIISFGLSVFVVCIAALTYREDFAFTKLETALYWALGRNIFAFSMGVLIFGMTQNIGWFALQVCQWTPIVVIGRVTFAAYMVHPTLIRLRAGHIRHPVHIVEYFVYHASIADVVLAYLVGTFLTLTIELPVSALQKLGKAEEEKEST